MTLHVQQLMPQAAVFNQLLLDKLEDDTFYAKVVLQTNKEQKEIDCRPSDALAMAV